MSSLCQNLPRRCALAVAAACAVASTGCSKPRAPTIAPEHATVTGVDAKALHLDVALSATNPNGVDLNVRDVTAHVVLGKTIDLGSVTLPQAMTLPAGKASTIDAPLAVPWNDLTALAQLVGGSGPIPFTIDGTVELGGDLLHVTVPYHLTGSVTQQQLMAATVRSLPAIPGLPR
jgi:LEA14-like dessication related protein